MLSIVHAVKKELNDLEPAKNAVRNFGLLFSGIFFIWAGTSYWRGGDRWGWFAAACVAVLLAGLWFPKFLRLPYRLWMLLAVILGWFMTRILLTAAYLLIMTPMGLLLRASGKDILDERLVKDSVSYWKKHESADDLKRYNKQF
jgi:saxitoxin biosynthesis operon SxtJ-like protein